MVVFGHDLMYDCTGIYSGPWALILDEQELLCKYCTEVVREAVRGEICYFDFFPVRNEKFIFHDEGLCTKIVLFQCLCVLLLFFFFVVVVFFFLVRFVCVCVYAH